MRPCLVLSRPELTLGLIKPNVYAHQPQVQGNALTGPSVSRLLNQVDQEILRTIKNSGLEIVRTKRIFWTLKDAEAFYDEHKGRFYFPRLTLHASTSPMLALALYGDDAIKRWRELIGPTHVYKTKWTHPRTLRARYGISDTRNGFHGSDSTETANKELDMIFEGWNRSWWIENRQKSQ